MSLVSRHAEKIGREEFHEIFYNKFFSTSMIEKKKIEFMAVKQRNMIVAECHAGTKGSKVRERTLLELQLVMFMVHCATLEELVGRPLECEAAHRI